jgi:uncharacterized protein (TIGR02217 family)
MSHLNEYLDQCAAYSFEIGPEFSTRLVERRNKRESRRANWSQVRHRASLPYENVTEAAYREIKRMFLVARGRLHTFKLEDPADHTATSEIFGVGDGAETEFQLRKISTADSVDYEREIYLPRSGATFTDNGSPVSPT